MNLVTESIDDSDSFPAALLQAGFGMAQIPCIKTDIVSMSPAQIGLAASPMGLTVNTAIAGCMGDGLLSPYTPTFLTREASYIPSPPVSPAMMVSPNSGQPAFTYEMAAHQLSNGSPASNLTVAMMDMGFPFTV